MSMGYRGKSTNLLRESIAVQAQVESESNWGELTGTVTTFNPSNQTISVKPDYQPMHNGKNVDMPELHEVPVRFPKSGGFIVTIPVKSGDKVVLRPQMRSSEEYHIGSDYNSPQDARSNSLSDMEAFLDGGEPLTDPISNFNNSNLEIRTESGEFKIEMTTDGKFRILGANGDIIKLLSDVVELLGSDALSISYGSSGGSGHQLQHRSTYSQIASKIKGMLI